MTERPPLLGTLESAFYVDDLGAAAKFWSEIIGLEKVREAEGRHVFFRVRGGVLLIFNAAATSIPPNEDAKLPVPPHGTSGPGHYCLAVDPADLDSWKSYLQEQGIDIEADFIWPQGGRSIYFRDPAGNSIELADPKIWD